MTQPLFRSPSLSSAFNCPYCNAYSQQVWRYCFGSVFDISSKDTLNEITSHGGNTPAPRISGFENAFVNRVQGIYVTECTHCKSVSLWVNDQIVFPRSRLVALPSSDMPEDISKDYEEASNIFGASPRGAAALLRLAIQKLCVHLGKPGKNINADIQSLVADGLPRQLQKAFDTLRVTGNEAVHPGEMNLNDDREVAHGLFLLVNMIVEKMIAEPRHVDALYGKLPKDKLSQIAIRDAPKK